MSVCRSALSAALPYANKTALNRATKPFQDGEPLRVILDASCDDSTEWRVVAGVYYAVCNLIDGPLGGSPLSEKIENDKKAVEFAVCMAIQAAAARINPKKIKGVIDDAMEAYKTSGKIDVVLEAIYKAYDATNKVDYRRVGTAVYNEVLVQLDVTPPAEKSDTREGRSNGGVIANAVATVRQGPARPDRQRRRNSKKR